MGVGDDFGTMNSLQWIIAVVAVFDLILIAMFFRSLLMSPKKDDSKKNQ